MLFRKSQPYFLTLFVPFHAIAIHSNDDNALPLRKRLTDNHYDFTYVEEEHANHSWAFWDAQIQNVLKWMFKKE